MNVSTSLNYSAQFVVILSFNLVICDIGIIKDYSISEHELARVILCQANPTFVVSWKVKLSMRHLDWLYIRSPQGS